MRFFRAVLAVTAVAAAVASAVALLDISAALRERGGDADETVGGPRPPMMPPDVPGLAARLTDAHVFDPDAETGEMPRIDRRVLDDAKAAAARGRRDLGFGFRASGGRPTGPAS